MRPTMVSVRRVASARLRSWWLGLTPGLPGVSGVSLGGRSSDTTIIPFPEAVSIVSLTAAIVPARPFPDNHGFPVRLVAPGRRGYWWVKWVDRIEPQTTPSWWQPPFPTG